MTNVIPYREEVFIVNGNIEVTVKGKFVEIEVEAELVDIPLPEDNTDYSDKDNW